LKLRLLAARVILTHCRL